MHAERWLILALVALYVYDCCWLMKPDELAFIQTAKRGWVPKLLNSHAFFGGRFILCRNPFLPYIATVRHPLQTTQESFHKAPDNWLTAAMQLTKSLFTLRVLSVLNFLLLLVVSPVVLLLGRYRVFLVIVAISYIFAITGILIVCYRRKSLNLSVQSLTSLAVDSFLCIPNSINLYRNIADRILSHQTDGLSLSKALYQDGEKQQQFFDELRNFGEVTSTMGLPLMLRNGNTDGTGNEKEANHDG